MKRIIGAVFHLMVIAALMNAFYLLVRNLRILRRLEDEYPPDDPGASTISVLIPARNEENALPRCLSSLQVQTWDRYTVTVLDDGSRDSTAEIARSFANTDSRFHLISGEPLPDGWAGKPWACHQLAEQANGDLLVFIDADTWFEPDLLARTAGLMQRERPDLLSLMSHLTTKTWGERLVLPGLYMLFLCGLPLWRLEDPRYSEIALANGQYICMPSDSYRRFGGHRAVHDRIVEDIALARVVKTNGGKVMARTAIDSMHCRMYRSAREVFDGFSKNAFIGFDEKPIRAIVAIAAMIATHLVPPGLLVHRLWNRRGGVPLLGFEVLGGIALRWIVSNRMKLRARDAWMAHLNAIAFVVIVARSMWWRYVSGGYRWKDRSYSPSKSRT
jgi:chlorobactene glucosyltransferase